MENNKYKIVDPNRQFNDWDSVEQQIEALDKKIDEAVAGEVSFSSIQGEPEDNVKLKEALDNKAAVGDSYTKAEDDVLLADKADKASTYNKTEVDTLLDDKADKTDLTALEGRVDTAEGNITDIQTALADKVDKEENKELMPTGLDDTVAQHTTDLQALQQAVANIPIIQVAVMPTPSAEYIGKIVQYIGPTSADAINGYFYQCGYDEELLAYKWMEKKVMNAAEEGGVDAYTKAETNQLLDNKQDKLTAGEGIKITGNVIMQDIINDTLSSPQTTWSSRYLESLFHSLSGLSSIEIVNERPAQPVNNTLYYIKAYEEGENPLYEIWFYSNNQWTNFGTTAIDLTNYYTKTEVDTLLTNKQDKLTEGQGISLTGNVATVKIDGTTLSINEAGNIYVKSGGGGGGGGFEPTSAQLSAMNSGITQAKREDYDTSLEDVSQLKSDMTQAQSDITDLDTNKADKSDTYTKTEVDTALADKADKSTTYTKTEVDTELGKKLDKRTSGNEVYSHNGDTQGALSVKTAMSATAADTNILTEKAVKTYVDSKGINWKYVGILSASTGSTITVEDDWTELLLCVRVNEGSAYYNLTNVLPKDGFTRGNPNGNQTFAGFFWNESYNAKVRVGLEGTGTSRKLKLNFSQANGWGMNGIYVLKR